MPAVAGSSAPYADMGDVRQVVEKMYHGRISASVIQITDQIAQNPLNRANYWPL
ncbi:hypothetical protein Sgleb_48890 [Streptomyces glebosus]|uniref:Uncharacterized protein n=1 Tax=Streptomyces glebosus TaxID=249580 RepID=A0A640T1B1_9ACTN|nr:hypothetical protein Sgleb_48890 [Streptomyces glebosus]